MKKTIATLALIIALAALCTQSALARRPKAAAEVTFATSMHCKNCQKKIVENISFEKGVLDLSADLDSKSLCITFDQAKTDTAKLAGAIRKLGYTAKVTEFKETK